jgi:hypothetical protein
MKKLLLIMVAIFGFLSCENPSVEDGLASLETALAELEAAMAGVNVDQMLTDVSSMQTQVETMQIDVDAYNEQAEGWLNQINDILTDLAAVQVIIDNAATTEQTDALLADVQEISAMIDQLVLIADYDADGVINGLDQCPETILGATVNNQGCSEVQLAAIASATASSTTTSSTTTSSTTGG